jgi:hypothetical protein
VDSRKHINSSCGNNAKDSCMLQQVFLGSRGQNHALKGCVLRGPRGTDGYL